MGAVRLVFMSRNASFRKALPFPLLQAFLKGLSPAANRSVPPLRYDDVYKLKREFPGLHITINGGITTFEQARGTVPPSGSSGFGGRQLMSPTQQVREHLTQGVDGTMIGRAFWKDPWLLSSADSEVFGAQCEAGKVGDQQRRLEVLSLYARCDAGGLSIYDSAAACARLGG